MGLPTSITVIIVAALSAGVAPAHAQAVRVPTTSKPENHSMSAPLPRIGFVSFYVANVERSLAFYVNKLGMREQGRIPLPNGVQEILLGFGELAEQPGIILMFDPKREKPYQLGDGFSRFVIRVADIRPLVKRLSEQGVPVVVPPTSVEKPKLTYSLVRDPDGYLIEFIES
jgi:lactoylglutathione lyase